MKVILIENQFIRLMDKLRDLIMEKKINPSDFIVLNKERNGIK